MSLTILEVLASADYNLQNNLSLGLPIIKCVKEQVHNAFVLLDKGYGLYENFDSIIDKYGDVINAPEKE